MHPRIMGYSLAAGLLLGGLCVPFIVQQTPPGMLRTLRIGFLFPIAIMLFQISLAWTFSDELSAAWRRGRKQDLIGAAAAGLILSAGSMLWLDPIHAGWFTGYALDNHSDILVSLPWVCLFQPLVMVAGVFAFTQRLIGRDWVGVAAVMVVYQAVAGLQFGNIVDTPHYLVIMLIMGSFGAIQGEAYRRCGFPGPVTIYFLLHLRHFF